MMTAISRANPEAAVIRYAQEYAHVRSLVDHLDSRGAARTRQDAWQLFDQLAVVEKHLLTAVKHLPAQCLDEREEENPPA